MEDEIVIKEKVVTIMKQLVSGKPDQGFQKITWYDFLFDAQLESQEEINQCALALLRGEFLFYGGSTYHIIGVECLDN